MRIRSQLTILTICTIAAGSKDVVGIGASLSNIAAEVMGGYGEMEKGVRSNREEMTRIDEAAGDLSKGVGDIDARPEAIGRFKTET